MCSLFAAAASTLSVWYDVVRLKNNYENVMHFESRCYRVKYLSSRNCANCIGLRVAIAFKLGLLRFSGCLCGCVYVLITTEDEIHSKKSMCRLKVLTQHAMQSELRLVLK